jgi:DnaB-like helicase N terminal domain.
MVAERGILHLLLEDQNRIDDVVSVLGDDFWSEPLHREIFRMVVRHRAQGGFEPARAMNELDEVAVMLMNRLLFEQIPGADPDRMMEDYITAVNKNLIGIKRTRLIQDLAEAEKTGDQDRMNQLMQQIQNLR